jgi:hypothetical protein
MALASKPKMKITYSTMSADNEELQSAFDAALEHVQAHMLGAQVPMFINGAEVLADEKTHCASPIARRRRAQSSTHALPWLLRAPPLPAGPRCPGRSAWPQCAAPPTS